MSDLGTHQDLRFHPLIEATPAALFVLDEGRVAYFNPAARRLVGRTARELIGLPFSSLLHSAYGDLVDERLGAEFHLHAQMARSEGPEVWIDLTLRPVLYRGAPATLVTAIDVTALKVSEIARRDAEVQLKLVQRAGRTVSWDWNVETDELVVYGLPAGLITECGPLLRTSRSALLDLLRPDDLIELKQTLQRSIDEQESFLAEVALQSPDEGLRWVVVRGQPIPSAEPHGRHVVGVATDVTERHHAEEALVKEQKQKLSMLASISDGVIRTDLTGRIEDMTAPAESVIGRSLDEVKGRRLFDVIKLVDTDTGRQLSDPIEVCLQDADRIGQPRSALIRHQDSAEVPIRFHTAVLRDRNAKPVGAFLVLKDLVEERQTQRSLVYMATHDPLTDLLNRNEFERRLGQILSTPRDADRRDVLLYLDIDGFKSINSTFGYPAGNRMLKQFSSFMKTRFRETDVLGRIGGDKFGVLLESCIPWQAREVVETLYRELRSFNFECDGTKIPVSLSTGMTGINAKMTEPERALGAAEAACYLAKQRGGDAFYEYEAQDVMNSPRHSQAEILHEIQVALRSDGFQLYAQQIAPLQAPEGDPPMFEILLRMHSRDGTLILPNLFIPVAERHRIMTAIDRWVFSHALEVISERTRSAADHQTMYMINISGQSLGDDGFLEFMLNQLSYRGVEPGRVCVEITETATVANFERAQRFVAVLKGRGCHFVLDDFGSGLSSFAYLRRFPLDFIKIDGQFVKGMTKDPTHQALVESINHVGHVMQIKTIAESVEDVQTAEVLRNMRVDYAQGHHFSFPEPVEIALSNDPSSGRDPARSSEIA